MAVKTIYITVVRNNGLLSDTQEQFNAKKTRAEDQLNDALNEGFMILKAKACSTTDGTTFVYQLWKADRETPHVE